MKNENLNTLINELNLAERSLLKAKQLMHCERLDILSERERESNEGIAFGSLMFGILQDVEKARRAISFIGYARDPVANKKFLDLCNENTPEDLDLTNSIYPRKNQEEN